MRGRGKPGRVGIRGGRSTSGCGRRECGGAMLRRRSGSTSGPPRTGTGAGRKTTAHVRIHDDGRLIDYKTGVITYRPTGCQSRLSRWSRPQMHPRFLTLTERELIADLRRQGARCGRSGGRWAGRPPRSNARSTARSVGWVLSAERVPSGPGRRAGARPKDSKLARRGPLREYVDDRLRERWSPEQICHAWSWSSPTTRSMRASPETIYQAIYVQARGGLRREVAAALRTGRTRRKPHRKPDQRTPPVHRRDGDDLRAAAGGRRPGGARPLGRRSDRRHPQRDRDRDPGRAHHPLRHARTPARRAHRRRGP